MARAPRGPPGATKGGPVPGAPLAASWEDAKEFIPERFIEGGSDMHVGFKGNDFRFLPFGAGRRMCPSINLAITNVKLMLENLIYHFDWELPLGVERIH